MRQIPHLMVNTAEIELWPGGLLRARSNRDARALARATHVLRRKRDGCYLAAQLPEGRLSLVTRLMHEPGIAEALDALDDMPDPIRPGIGVVDTLSAARVQQRLETVGLDADDYAARTGLVLMPEPTWLAFAGRDCYGRPLWLHIDAVRAWQRLHRSALSNGIVLDAISGYRSHDYQLGIFERKLARGQSIDEILAVNAAPGYSEHHSGRAIDVGTPGEAPADASFEFTPAFAWLSSHAAEHGFHMSYPRDNSHGIVFEPWHWAYGNRCAQGTVL